MIYISLKFHRQLISIGNNAQFHTVVQKVKDTTGLYEPGIPVRYSICTTQSSTKDTRKFSLNSL